MSVDRPPSSCQGQSALAPATGLASLGRPVVPAARGGALMAGGVCWKARAQQTGRIIRLAPSLCNTSCLAVLHKPLKTTGTSDLVLFRLLSFRLGRAAPPRWLITVYLLQVA
jgi:hypothetical protein